MTQARTVGELRRSGYRSRSVKDELRENLLARLRKGDTTFAGIHGYDRTVIPAIHNAILARHDMILLGLRGQAKTRILRALTSLLDEYLPVVAGCEMNDQPLAPFCKRCRRLSGEKGDDLPIEWLERSDRYREKLATPDVTVADLVGDIDPIKAANQRLTYADEEVIHFGIIPRTNRGIFAINELPDLAPRIQVALLNILEERDLQIRGFPVRIPLDVMLVFSANPEDYTSRGNIITPLKDRIDSQILTHYPQNLATASTITQQEAWMERPGFDSRVVIPQLAATLIEHLAFVARESELVDQSSGVSARMTISAIELLRSNLERRAVLTGEDTVYPRLSDFAMVVPAVTGKVEMVYEGEQQGPEVVARKLIGTTVVRLFNEKFPPIERLGRAAATEESKRRYMEVDYDDAPPRKRGGDATRGEAAPSAESVVYEPVIEWFMEGNKLTLSDEQPFKDHYAQLEKVPHLGAIADRYLPTNGAGERAFVMELILEALHQALRLSREDLDSTITFGEMLKFNLLRTVK